MPKEIDGEVFYTQEELDQQIEEKEDELSTKIQELENASDSEKEELQKQVDTLTEDLEKAKGKDTNFNKLRKSKEDTEQENEELKSKLDETNNTVSSILENIRVETIESVIEGKLDTDDKDTKEVFDKYFEQLGGNKTNSVKEIRKIAQDAMVLTQQDVTNEEDGGIKSQIPVKPRAIPKSKEGKQETEASKEFSKAFRISDEDKEKYDPSKEMDLV